MVLEQKIVWTHLAILILAIPLALKMVRRNRFYGFRLKKTLSSDAIWYPANALAGRLMMVGSILGIAIVGWVESGLLPLAETSITLVSLAPTLLGVGYSLIWVSRKA